jgi:hypothetical protein
VVLKESLPEDCFRSDVCQGMTSSHAKQASSLRKSKVKHVFFLAAGRQARSS